MLDEETDFTDDGIRQEWREGRLKVLSPLVWLETAICEEVPPPQKDKEPPTFTTLIEYREATPDMDVTLVDVDTNEPTEVHVKPWHELGTALKALPGIRYKFGVETVFLGGMVIGPHTTRWEDHSIEDRATLTVKAKTPTQRQIYDVVRRELKARNPFCRIPDEYRDYSFGDLFTSVPNPSWVTYQRDDGKEVECIENWVLAGVGLEQLPESIGLLHLKGSLDLSGNAPNPYPNPNPNWKAAWTCPGTTSPLYRPVLPRSSSVNRTVDGDLGAKEGGSTCPTIA